MPLTRDEAWNRARSILDRLGLFTWKLCFTAKRNLFGLCDYENRRIDISWFLHKGLPESELVDTVLHEAAHAFTPGDGHGPLWKARCLQLGCRPEATKTVPLRRLGPWVATCPRCGVVSDRWVRPKRDTRYYCTDCPPKVYLEWRKRDASGYPCVRQGPSRDALLGVERAGE